MEKILAFAIVYLVTALSLVIVAAWWRFLNRKSKRAVWILTVTWNDERKECYKYVSKEMAERANDNIIRNFGTKCWTAIEHR